MRVEARIAVPGRIFEAEQLWCDTSRWPAFVDGLHHVDRKDPGWPREAGAALRWISGPGGRGLVREEVVLYEPRARLVQRVEDERTRGTQTVSFEALAGGEVRVTLTLEYELKDDSPARGLKALFSRRPQRDALQRTLNRFAWELEGDLAEWSSLRDR